jgi:type I restriction enzyme, S subunit
LFLRISNLTRNHVHLIFQDVQYVSPPLRAAEGQRTKVTEGDLLISITADLGIIGVIPAGLGEAYVNQHIALVRLYPQMVNPNWIANYLAFGASQRQFYRLNDQGAKAGMNLPTIEKLIVAKPDVEEQNRIAAVIDTHETRIRTEEQYLSKLKLEKEGLMQDLLTGRVRVKVPGEDARS